MEIEALNQRLIEQVKNEALARSYAASNELRSAALHVLRGQRHGRRYRVPYTLVSGRPPSGRQRKPRYYTASAPGEPPAARTGTLRLSWFPRPKADRSGRQWKIMPAIESELKYARPIEEGTAKMAPRPYADLIRARALPRIRAIYGRPYLR